MKYKILATYTETDTFEDALTLVGAVPQPEFEETPGELFALRPDQIQTSSALAMFEHDGVYILQTPDAADELTEDEAEDIAGQSLDIAEMFLNEINTIEPFPRHDPPGIG